MTLLTKIKKQVRASAELAESVTLPRLPSPPCAAGPVPPAVMLLIYRHRNVSLVEGLVAEARSCGIRVFLWGLTGVAASLAAWTVGAGPGLRNALLSRLLDLSDPAPDDHVLICDDDAVFAIGGMAEFINLSVAGGFALAQPTHVQASHYSFRFTCGRPHLIARSTLFVEVGPVVLVHPGFRDRVFPMRADLGMGWAEAVCWHRDKLRGERFGLIDAVRIRHCHPVGLDYDTASEQATLDRLLAEVGLPGLAPMLRTVDRWPRWRAEPPWSAAPVAPHEARHVRAASRAG